MASIQMQRRNFMRHPADIPLDIAIRGTHRDVVQRLKDVSEGGLAYLSRRPLGTGSTVVLSIPLVQPPFSAAGVVVWCHRQGSVYEVGVRFADAEDLFAARMVEQVCQIEHYRQQVQRAEGRVLDAETAAREWIKRYAASFPALGKGSTH